MAARTKLNSAGMAALLKSAEVRADLTARANRVASAARSAAPVASGEYRDSIEVVSDTTDRAVERVVARAPHGYIVEANHGTLARALDAGR